MGRGTVEDALKRGWFIYFSPKEEAADKQTSDQQDDAASTARLTPRASRPGSFRYLVHSRRKVVMHN
jgi:hypothetical protein